MIDVRDLSKNYGSFAALRGVSFQIEKGGAAALWGMNGAGKTTTIRCIMGLTKFSGEIRVGGVDVGREGRRARSLIGYVPQHFPGYDMPVRGLARYVSGLRGVDIGEARRRLEDVGLADQWRKPVCALSGGMKQRLGLALALMGSPSVLILDEPTSGLDYHGRDELFEALTRVRGNDVTVLFSSHRPEEVAYLADRVITLESGRLLSVEPASAWYEAYMTDRQRRGRVTSAGGFGREPVAGGEKGRVEARSGWSHLRAERVEWS